MKFIILTVCCFFLSFFSKGEAYFCSCNPNDCFVHRAFLSVGWGYSWSEVTKIEANPSFWDPSPQGYDSDLNHSELYLVGLGYHITPLISAMLDFSYRPNFSYQKFQTSTASSTPGFLGTKTRHFKLSSWAYQLDIFLNKAGNYWQFGWNSGCFNCCVAPFLGAGLGVAYNRMTNFHSTEPVLAGATFPIVAGILEDYTKVAFAAQVMVGLISQLTDRLNLEIGYRRFHGGRIKSGNYVLSIPSGFTANAQVPPFKGWLNANEIYLSLNYLL